MCVCITTHGRPIACVAAEGAALDSVPGDPSVAKAPHGDHVADDCLVSVDAVFAAETLPYHP